MQINFFGVFALLIGLGVVNSIMARNRNRNPVLWFCLAFVPFINILFTGFLFFTKPVSKG